MNQHCFPIIAGAIALLPLTVNAESVAISSVTGHHGGQRFGEENGTLGEMIDLTGIDTTTNGTPNDPGSWFASSSSWPDEWQANSLLDNTLTDNAKIGWVVIDLGGVTTDLENLYIWNVRENNTRNVADYNLYHASSPTVAVPDDPGSDTLNADVGASGGAGDYNFASGGWTQIGGTLNMSDRFDAGEGSIANDVIALGGISARYLAIEILSNDGDANRVGMAEIAVTAASSGGGDSFSNWIAGFNVSDQTGIDDDPDGDGIDSGVENFFGTAPDTFSEGLIAGTATGGNSFTFTHPQGSLADDLTASYRWSTGLETFLADGAADGAGTRVVFSVETDTPVTGTTTITGTVTEGVLPRTLFVDVEVTQP